MKPVASATRTMLGYYRPVHRCFATNCSVADNNGETSSMLQRGFAMFSMLQRGFRTSGGSTLQRGLLRSCCDGTKHFDGSVAPLMLWTPEHNMSHNASGWARRDRLSCTLFNGCRGGRSDPIITRPMRSVVLRHFIDFIMFARWLRLYTTNNCELCCGTSKCNS